MPCADEYKTIKGFQRFSFLEKGSKFIASASPVFSEEEALKKIKQVSKEFFKADHHCFAHKIFDGKKETIRTNDAGEPKGTAGKPILLAIECKKLSNVLVIVTRFFGGTKLGKPGLFKAYQRSALAVLENCEIVTKFFVENVLIHSPLNLIGKVKKVLGQFDVVEKKSEYLDKVTLEIEVKKSQVEKLKKELTELTKGEVKFLERI
jgi:uncharacterized YigZ family protein